MNSKLFLFLLFAEKAFSYGGGGQMATPPSFYGPSDWGWVYPKPTVPEPQPSSWGKPPHYPTLAPPTDHTWMPPPPDCRACLCNCDCATNISNPNGGQTGPTCPPCPPTVAPPTAGNGTMGGNGNGTTCAMAISNAYYGTVQSLGPLLGQLIQYLFANLGTILGTLLTGNSTTDGAVIPLLEILCFILGIVLLILRLIGALSVVGADGLITSLLPALRGQ